MSIVPDDLGCVLSEKAGLFTASPRSAPCLRIPVGSYLCKINFYKPKAGEQSVAGLNKF